MRGLQRPRLQNIPPYLTSSGPDVVDLCAAVGVHLDPWQQYVLEGSLGEDASGRFTSFEAAMIVSRQNGKGEILLARQLAGLFLFGEKLIMHSAHEYKTAAEAFLRVKAVIENNDSLIKLCKKPRTSHGEEGIEMLDGRRLRFVARSGGSGRGFTGDCIILDEAYELGAAQMAAMLPTLSARENPQLWYASSAGMESSTQLTQVRNRGIAGSKSLAYYEWSAEATADLDDEAAWAQANPALGIRISDDFIRREREAMPDIEFGRERLGIWDDLGRLAVIPFDIWEQRIQRDSKPVDPLTFGVDVSMDRGIGSIALAGRRSDGLAHIEVVDTQLGTGWLVDRLTQLWRRWHPTSVRLDGSGPVGSIIAPLVEAGVNVEVVGMREYVQACGGFYDAVISGQLRHLDQPPLTAAVQSARQRPLGDAWAWNRKESSSDITPLVAATLALHGLAEHQAGIGIKQKGAPGRGRLIALT